MKPEPESESGKVTNATIIAALIVAAIVYFGRNGFNF